MSDSDADDDFIPAPKRFKKAVINSDESSEEEDEASDNFDDDEDLSDIEFSKPGSSKRPIDSTTEEEFDSDETDTDDDDDSGEQYAYFWAFFPLKFGYFGRVEYDHFGFKSDRSVSRNSNTF